MALIPDSLVGKIQFNEAHLSDWSLHAAGIGSSAGEITALQALTEAARAALTDQQTAQETAKTKTAALRMAVDAMSTATSALITKVRAKAASDGDSVYQLANIPAPATPTPVGAPGTPFQFKAELIPNGSLGLSWKCNNPTGCSNVIYQVYRKVESTGAYEYIGGTGTREFSDTSVPQGVPSVMYQIQGTRSTAVGVAGEFIVNFGVNSGGAITAAVANATKPAKIAA